jgi:hypothetical protein
MTADLLGEPSLDEEIGVYEILSVRVSHVVVANNASIIRSKAQSQRCRAQSQYDLPSSGEATGQLPIVLEGRCRGYFSPSLRDGLHLLIVTS